MNKTEMNAVVNAFRTMDYDAFKGRMAFIAHPAAHSGWLEPGRNGADFLTPRYPAPTPLFTPPAQT